MNLERAESSLTRDNGISLSQFETSGSNLSKNQAELTGSSPSLRNELPEQSPHLPGNSPKSPEILEPPVVPDDFFDTPYRDTRKQEGQIIEPVADSGDSNAISSGIMQYIEQSVSSGNKKIPIGDLLNIAQIDHENFTRQRANDLCELIQSLGYGVVPNPTLHGIKPRSTSFLTLLNLSDYDTDIVSTDFYLTTVLVHLSGMVSQADGHIHESEVALTRSVLESRSDFSSFEKDSLVALFEWSQQNQISYKGIRRNIKKLGEDQRETVWSQLADVAIVDQNIDPREIIVLAKIYDLLELDQSAKAIRLSAINNTFSSAGDQSEQTASLKIRDKEENNIGGTPDSLDLQTQSPPPVEKQGTVATGIDQDRLKKKRIDNDAVRDLFKDIFVEDDETDFYNDGEDEEIDSIEDTSSDSNPLSSNLDKQHRKLARKLIVQDEWTRQEFEILCEKYDLLPDSAIEFINDWSYEIVDAPLLEDDEKIYVDRSLNVEI
ncbi:hypothetical protein AB833_08390 [Chromatiales bacterium (ex Bugula neritina AB1)]|nr:hypothetical protein AB833_08390 [Chromatiales bacterium (ex Bugula neritina AB1)]